MNRIHREILARHAGSLAGRLRLWRYPSKALGLRKALFVYEPPGYVRGMETPVVWLFRGHEREWANVAEDASRLRTTAVEDVDRFITSGRIPPTVLVLPGLTSSNNHVHGLGIDMVAPTLSPQRGLGTGRFWTYLTDELIPAVERRYAATQRLAAGFSLGGFTVSLLAFGRPGWLTHAAFYDALFAWPRHDDPRVTPPGPLSDRIFGGASILAPPFGWPRDPDALHRWNPTDWLVDADAATRLRLRQTTYWLRCAAADGSRGNRDRALALQTLLRESSLPLGYESVVLHPDAAHTWHWCDRFLGEWLLTVLGTSTEAPPPLPEAAPDPADSGEGRSARPAPRRLREQVGPAEHRADLGEVARKLAVLALEEVLEAAALHAGHGLRHAVFLLLQHLGDAPGVEAALALDLAEGAHHHRREHHEQLQRLAAPEPGGLRHAALHIVLAPAEHVPENPRAVGGASAEQAAERAHEPAARAAAPGTAEEAAEQRRHHVAATAAAELVDRAARRGLPRGRSRARMPPPLVALWARPPTRAGSAAPTACCTCCGSAPSCAAIALMVCGVMAWERSC